MLSKLGKTSMQPDNSEKPCVKTNANLDVNLILSQFDLQKMFSAEFVEKAVYEGMQFSSMLKDLQDKLLKGVNGQGVYLTIGILWDTHKRLMSHLNPFCLAFVVLHDISKQEHKSSLFETNNSEVSANLLYSLYIDHYEQMIEFMSINDFFLIEHAKTPNIPVPNQLINNFMPTMNKLEMGDENSRSNVIFNMLCGMKFQHKNDASCAFNIIGKIKPQKNESELLDYLNDKANFSYRNRLIGYDPFENIPKKITSLFGYADRPKLAYIDRIEKDNGLVTYKLFFCPAPVETFAEHIKEMGVMTCEDSFMYEWNLDTDSEIIKDWMTMSDSIESLSESGEDIDFTVGSLMHLKCLQLMNIVNFLAMNFEFYYFNGIGLFQNNTNDKKLENAIVNERLTPLVS